MNPHPWPSARRATDIYLAEGNMLRRLVLYCLLTAAAPLPAQPLAPLPAQPAPVSSHAPFESGDCALCHAGTDPRKPGPVTASGPQACLGCHEEFAGVLARPHVHAPAKQNCTACHNPHNARQRKLLVDDPARLCTGCHADIGKHAAGAKVPHKALTTGKQCAGCHEPHGSAVAKLLVQQSFDLCVDCHATDTLVGANGRKLQNTKAWLEANRNWHGPVASKDCSACHQPHGGDHFRLLATDYPAEFYAPYDPRTYALCFSCHQESAYSTARTTTLTSFRNGDQNLHYVHLQQSGRGRTCRACHEVHASKQEHHLREGVPYGSGGWTLKLNFRKAANGGSCEKTCHGEKGYTRAPGK